MIALGVVASRVTCDSRGLALGWRWWTAERWYAGASVSWEQVRDIAPFSAPPEVRLHDGRRLFVSAEVRDELSEAAEQAGIPIVRGPDTWADLLEVFLDAGLGEEQRAGARRLQACGFSDTEIAWIRARYGRYMIPLAMLTGEWAHVGQADLIEARHRFKLLPFLSRPLQYRRFRRWTDGVAARAESSAKL